MYFIFVNIIFIIYIFFFKVISHTSKYKVRPFSSEPFKQYEKFYNDPANQRTKIREDNNGKIGVYA